MHKTRGYLRHVKQLNMSGVLKQIWKFGPISRIELAERTRLTSGTITNLTQQLLRAGLLGETAHSTGHVGRNRIMLRIDTERFALIGIDIGRNCCEVVAADLSGRILASKRADTAGVAEPREVLRMAADMAETLISAAQSQRNRVLGVGLGIPGPMDVREGVLLNPPNFPNWDRFPVKSELERLLDRQVLIHDDARTSALAERWFGYGRRQDNFVYVAMGDGIGGSVVADGELLLGANGLHGQLGHMTVVPDGEPCACGNRGCWETVGSIPGILRRWRGSGHGSTIAHFFRAVREGDPKAKDVLEATLGLLASTLTTLCNVYDPEMIILGGKLYAELQEELPRIRGQVRSSVYPFARSRVTIESASFGVSQSAVGAAALVFGELMNHPLDVLERLGIAG